MCFFGASRPLGYEFLFFFGGGGEVGEFNALIAFPRVEIRHLAADFFHQKGQNAFFF